MASFNDDYGRLLCISLQQLGVNDQNYFFAGLMTTESEQRFRTVMYFVVSEVQWDTDLRYEFVQSSER